MNTLLASVFALSIAASGAAYGAAQATPSAPASSVSPLSPIYVCAEKTDPVERLACFDSAVAAVKAAEARSEIITMDQPRVAAVRREAFGFRIPSLPRFGFGGGASGGPTSGGAAGTTSGTLSSSARAQEREELEDAQTFAVARVGQAGNRVAIYLENGNIWHLTEAGDLNAPSRPPFNVRIRAAAMGSYMLTVEGRNKGYRVRRVE